MAEYTEKLTRQLGKQEVKRSLDASVRDGVLLSIMAGLGDAYMPALLILHGATDATIGLLTSVPYAIAAFAQLFISRGMQTWKNNKKFVTGAALFYEFF